MNLFSTNIAYAATPELDKFIRNVDRLIINPIITLLFAIAVVYFLYGVFQFLWASASEEKKTNGKSHMLWGIIGITIMMSVWAILGIVMRTIGVTGINPQQGTVELR